MVSANVHGPPLSRWRGTLAYLTYNRLCNGRDDSASVRLMLLARRPGTTAKEPERRIVPSETEMQAPETAAPRHPRVPLSRRLKQLSQEQIVLITTVCLAAAFTILVPGFASIENMLTLLNGIAVLGILSLGAAIVIIGRGLDISQVASLAIGAALAAVVMRDGGGIASGITGAAWLCPASQQRRSVQRESSSTAAVAAR